MKFNKQLLAGLGGAVVTLGLTASALTFAQTASTTSPSPDQHKMPGVAGTVSAVSGNTITLTGQNGTTYTIDAASASITKDETVSVSDLKVGDTLMAEGAVNGTTVTATNIHAGTLPHGGFGFGGMHGHGRGVHGTVSAVSGTTLTVVATNPQDQSSTTYTVDAGNAKVLRGDGTNKPTDSSVSAVAVGDTVMIDGEISGTNITAKVVFDGEFPHNRAPPAQASTQSN